MFAHWHPHVMEAYNHKVNHDSHKELGPQEHVVLQYGHALQYVSFCNDERYKDHLAPAVKAFWSEVVEHFSSRALHNLDLSHILGSTICPNRGAKIPDYGVWDHIAQVCAPFFQGIESQSQYESRRHCRRRSAGAWMPRGITIVPPMVLKGEPGNERRGDPRQQNQADHGVSLELCGT